MGVISEGDIVMYVTRSGADIPVVVVEVIDDETIVIDRDISGYGDTDMTVSYGFKRNRWHERIV